MPGATHTDGPQVIIVGSGPSAFYAAQALLRGHPTVGVTLLERLPCPFGLVRYGVAPDNPKIRSVTRIFETLAADPRVRWFGQVTVGEAVPLAALRASAAAVIVASGAADERWLGIPGETLAGCHGSREFVAWYNGHPDAATAHFDLRHPVAAVIGHGNVALDVARILLHRPETLAQTDIAGPALAALRASQVREVHLIGRRGPAQAAFTPVELRGLEELADCDLVINPADLVLDEATQAVLAQPHHAHAKRNLEHLRALAERPVRGSSRRLVLRFFLSPRAVLGPERVTGLELGRNTLVGEPANPRAVPTGETLKLDCGLILRSVGYRGVPLPGLPFDAASGVVPHERGRVLAPTGGPLPGLYVAGWAKRGPTGVIGDNKADAAETVASLLADWQEAAPASPGEAHPALTAALAQAVDYTTWHQLDAWERQRGAAQGRPRDRFCTWQELQNAVAQARAGGACP